MINRMLSALPFCLAIFSTFAHAQAGQVEKPVFSSEPIASGIEIDALEEKSLAGDSDAAIRLMWVALDEDNQECALYWARIAMENGSAIGRHNYASLLGKKGDFASLTRAIYHLEILAARGNNDAAVLLEIYRKDRNILLSSRER